MNKHRISRDRHACGMTRNKRSDGSVNVMSEYDVIVIDDVVFSVVMK